MKDRDSDVVIVVGGFQGSSSLKSTEIFDAENNVWIEGGKVRQAKSKKLAFFPIILRFASFN